MPDPFPQKQNNPPSEPESYRMSFYTGYNEEAITQHEDFQQEYDEYHSDPVEIDDPLPLEAAARKTSLFLYGLMAAGSVLMILRILFDFTSGYFPNILLPAAACALLLLVGGITILRTKQSEKIDRYRKLPNILCVELFLFDIFILAFTGLSNPNKVGYLVVSSMFIGIAVLVSFIMKWKKSALAIPVFLTIYSFCIGILLQYSYLTLQMNQNDIEANYIYFSLTERPEPEDRDHHYYINVPYEHIYPAALFELPSGVTSVGEYQTMLSQLTLTKSHWYSDESDTTNILYVNMLFERMYEKMDKLQSTYNEEFFQQHNLFILIDAFPGDEVLGDQVDYIKIGRNVMGGGMKVMVEGHRQTGVLRDGLSYPNNGCCFILISVPKSVNMVKDLDTLSSNFEEKEVIFTVKKKQRQEAEEEARKAEEESRAAARHAKEKAAEAMQKQEEASKTS